MCRVSRSRLLACLTVMTGECRSVEVDETDRGLDGDNLLGRAEQHAE